MSATWVPTRTDHLTDVSARAPAAGQVRAWNAATGVWEPAGGPIAATLSGAMPVDTGGTTIVRWDSPDPGVGSWRVLAGAQTFAGVHDPMLMLAYNMQLDSGQPIVAGEPGLALGLEAHACYPAEPGKHYGEFYLHYCAANSTVPIRPIFLRIDRNAADPLNSVQDFNLAGSTITLCHPDGTVYLTASKDAVTALRQLVIGAGAVFQAGASQVVNVFSGASDEAFGFGPNSAAVTQMLAGVGGINPALGGSVITYSNGDVILASANYTHLCWFHGTAGDLSIDGAVQAGSFSGASATLSGTVSAGTLATSAGSSTVQTAFSGASSQAFGFGPATGAVTQMLSGVGGINPALGASVLTYANGDVILANANYTHLCQFHGNTGNLSIDGAFQGASFLPAAPPVLSYSRSAAGETAAGAALRQALATLGLVTDSTTA